MSIRLSTCLLAATLAAAPALGIVTLDLSYQFSSDLSGNSAFTPSIVAAPGQPVLTRLIVNWSYPGALYFGGLDLNSIPIINTTAGDVVNLQPGSPALIANGLIRKDFGTANINVFKNQAFQVAPNGPTQLKVIPGSGLPTIVMLQEKATDDPDFLADNPVWTLQFLFTPAASSPARDITIGGGNADVKAAAVYMSLAGAAHSFFPGEYQFNPGTIHVIPAPSTLALTALLTSITPRRRRPL